MWRQCSMKKALVLALLVSFVCIMLFMDDTFDVGRFNLPIGITPRTISLGGGSRLRFLPLSIDERMEEDNANVPQQLYSGVELTNFCLKQGKLGDIEVFLGKDENDWTKSVPAVNSWFAQPVVFSYHFNRFIVGEENSTISSRCFAEGSTLMIDQSNAEHGHISHFAETVAKLPSLLLEENRIDRVWNARFWEKPVNDWQLGSLQAMLGRSVMFEGAVDYSDCTKVCFQHGIWPGVQRKYFMSHYAGNVFRRRAYDYCNIQTRHKNNSDDLVATLVVRNGKRRLLNYKDVESSLVENGFKTETIINLGGSFCGQVERFANSDVVVGIHGAELINGLFMRPGSVIMELMTKNFHHPTWKMSSALVSVNYVEFVSETPPMFAKEGLSKKWENISNPEECSARFPDCVFDHRDADMLANKESISSAIQFIKSNVLNNMDWLKQKCMQLKNVDAKSLTYFEQFNYLYCFPNNSSFS